MEDGNGAHAPPIDDALQQGMEAGDAEIDHGEEEAGMEDGDDGAHQGMEGDQVQAMEAADAWHEEAVEDEDAALILDDMEDEDALQDMEAGHAGLEEVMEDVDDEAVQDMEGDQGQGMEDEDDAGLEQAMEVEDDAGIEQGFEDGDDGAVQDMEGNQGQGMEDEDDAEFEQALEDEDDAGFEQAMEDEDNAGFEQALEDEDDAEIEQAVEDGDEAGVDQGMDAAAAAVIDIEEIGGGVALLPQNHVLPLSIPAYESSPARLLLQRNEFHRSGPLESIVLLAECDEDGDGPPDTVGPLFRDGDYRSIDSILPEWTLDLNLIRETFNARTHATIEALLFDGRRIQLDFLRKICVEVDEDGTPLRTLAMYWFDDQYRVFASARIFGMDEDVVRQRFNEECRGRLVITAVRRCCHSLHSMNPFCERIQVQRPVFGWYGAEAELVEYMAFQDESIHTNWHRVEMLNFERPHGHGVHIAPMSRIMKSAMLSMVGAFHQECHMLLCALAPGFRETVLEGSEQDSPSNSLFQSGVGLDQLGNDLWYLFWDTSDPGGVLPLYVVSFRHGH